MSLQDWSGWLLLAAYLSLLLEMTLFALPSEASTLQLFTGEAEPGDQRLAEARRRPAWVKALCYLLPTALGVLCFLLPLAVLFWPPLAELLLPLPDWPAVMTAGGLGLILAGRLLCTVAVFQLRRQHRRGQHELQPKGLFRFTRNPILLGMYLFYLGNCLWLPSPFLAAGFWLYTWNMHRRVLMEEDFLSARLGAAYRAYLAAVPRYLGIPRRGSEAT